MTPRNWIGLVRIQCVFLEALGLAISTYSVCSGRKAVSTRYRFQDNTACVWAPSECRLAAQFSFCGCLSWRWQLWMWLLRMDHWYTDFFFGGVHVWIFLSSWCQSELEIHDMAAFLGHTMIVMTFKGWKFSGPRLMILILPIWTISWLALHFSSLFGPENLFRKPEFGVTEQS